MIRAGIVILIFLLTAPSASGHGGVVEEDDICVIKVNYLRAHFKIYQPRIDGHEQFCEDLPNATESVFVMEYMHDALQTMPIDFRIIRDVTGKGRFARMEDIKRVDDLDGATVFYQAPIVEPDVYTISHTFVEEGDFIGIVSARHPDTGVVYASVFPFEVGFTGVGYWPFIIGLLVLIQIQYLFMSGKLKRWLGNSAAVAVLLLIGVGDARADGLIVTYTALDGPIEINRMHSWIVHIENAAGEPVTGALVEVEGGMPAHDHGLPTAPRVTAELGNGDYRLDGIRFHMRGRWEMTFRIQVAGQEDTVVVVLDL